MIQSGERDLTEAVISVRTYPGEMELTRMPYRIVSGLLRCDLGVAIGNQLTYSASSLAIAGHMDLTAPLVPQYAE